MWADGMAITPAALAARKPIWGREGGEGEEMEVGGAGWPCEGWDPVGGFNCKILSLAMT